MLIFFTSDGQFLACAANSCSRKINPEVHSLKFASFLTPMVSHLDSRLFFILTDLLKEALPALHCQPIVFARLAQFQPAARTRCLKLAFKLPHDHAQPTNLPLLQSMLGNLVVPQPIFTLSTEGALDSRNDK